MRQARIKDVENGGFSTTVDDTVLQGGNFVHRNKLKIDVNYS